MTVKRRKSSSADHLVHGANINQKKNHPRKYQDPDSKKYLIEIEEQYQAWKQANEELHGPSKDKDGNDSAIIRRRVQLFEVYKRFLDDQKYAEKFDSRSNLHSSALEEFMYYLFRDLALSFSRDALIGKAHTFKDLFFVSSSYAEMVSQPGGIVETKDHDFVIGATIWAFLSTDEPTSASVPNLLHDIQSEAGLPPSSNTDLPVDDDEDEHDRQPDSPSQLPMLKSKAGELHRFDVPAVAIECKTYLDKTMFEASARAAEELKARNPNGLYIVVMERIKLSEKLNLRKFKIDQIYVLRQQRNIDREFRHTRPEYYKPISETAVAHLFNFVRDFLTNTWEVGLDKGIERGYLL